MGTLVCFLPLRAYRQSQQALQARAKPCKPLLLPPPQHWGSKLKVGLRAWAAGTWFSLCRSVLLLPAICHLGHLAALPSPNTGCGLWVFRQGTQIRHLLKLSQRLEVEAGSVETENKP